MPNSGFRGFSSDFLVPKMQNAMENLVVSLDLQEAVKATENGTLFKHAKMEFFGDYLKFHIHMHKKCSFSVVFLFPGDLKIPRDSPLYSAFLGHKNK